jgi:hypothetical protein
MQAGLLRENIKASPAVHKHPCLDWFRVGTPTPFFTVFTRFYYGFSRAVFARQSRRCNYRF